MHTLRTGSDAYPEKLVWHSKRSERAGISAQRGAFGVCQSDSGMRGDSTPPQLRRGLVLWPRASAPALIPSLRTPVCARYRLAHSVVFSFGETRTTHTPALSGIKCTRSDRRELPGIGRATKTNSHLFRNAPDGLRSSIFR